MLNIPNASCLTHSELQLIDYFVSEKAYSGMSLYDTMVDDPVQSNAYEILNFRSDFPPYLAYTILVSNILLYHVPTCFHYLDDLLYIL